MSDQATVPDDYGEAGELRQTEPPRMLSNGTRDAFLALLDGDHQPNEALKAAAAEYKAHRASAALERPTSCAS